MDNKIISGLKCCLVEYEPNCDACPYRDVSESCREKLQKDVLEELSVKENIQDMMIPRTNFGIQQPVWYTCSVCGVRIAEKDRYCKNCGRKVKWE